MNRLLGIKCPVRIEIHRYIRLPLPPLPEQTAIVRYLDKASADIDAARARRQIEFRQDYRTCLISDVVTGKLYVRQAMVDSSLSLE